MREKPLRSNIDKVRRSELSHQKNVGKRGEGDGRDNNENENDGTK